MVTRAITASIPYVNADPHIGYAWELLQTDALVRFWRSQGDRVHAQFGTDDNSLKVVRAAQEVGEDVEVYAARHAEVFRSLPDLLGLDFGRGEEFMRTRDDRHIRGAQKFWSMFNPDDLERRSYTGNYCVGCEAFYAAEDLVEGNCPAHHKPIEVIEETNWFFKLSRYQTRLEELMVSDRLRIAPIARKNEVLAFIRRGLEDISISRSVARAAGWGVPVPGDPDQIMYVWVDALSQYITAKGFADDAPTYREFWETADTRAHVIGKDISRFHAVFWPAFLLSAGLPLPTHLFVHGFLTLNGKKISKSLGNVIAPAELVEKYGVEAARFLLLSALPLDNDGDLSDTLFAAQHARLANGLGNLVGRVAAMAQKVSEGVVPTVPFVDGEAHTQACAAAMEAADVRTYLEEVWSVVDAANRMIEEEAPFRVAKTDPAAATATLARLAAMIRWISTALAPMLPQTSAEILARYGGDRLVHGAPLFPRRDV